MSMVIFMKLLLKQYKLDITRRLYLNGIPSNVLTSSGFRAIHENYYNNYTVLSRITFNNNVDHYYRIFFIACAEKLMHRIHKQHGESFLHVMHNMVTLNNGNNYLEAPVSFMVDFDL